MTLIVGLTGGIGSGKTRVADTLAELGVGIVDADVVAREVVTPGSNAVEKIAQHFGPHLVDQQGHLRRSELRRIIFSDSQAKVWLESLLHPLIHASIKRQLEQNKTPYGVLVSPLLLETGQKELVQKVVVVDAEASQQLARSSRRDSNSVEQIKAIMATQMPRQERLVKADIVVDNTQDLHYLAIQVDQLHQSLLSMTALSYA